MTDGILAFALRAGGGEQTPKRPKGGGRRDRMVPRMRADLPYLAFERRSGRLVASARLHRSDWALPATEVVLRNAARSPDGRLRDTCLYAKLPGEG